MAPNATDYSCTQSEAVIVVDPYSTGCVMAKEFQEHGYILIAVWTRGFAEAMKKHIPMSCKGLTYYAELDEQESLEKTADLVHEVAAGFTIASCFAAGEAGVDFADAFSEYLGLLTNGTEIPNRRDKKVQQELIKARGLRSVRQACSDKFEDVEEFLRTEEFPVVLKPLQSAGSDGVKLCHTFEEAKEHFHLLMQSQMVNGGMCPAVLCQEFLKGKEYVVDHVSRDGVHKTIMTWVYDKRRANDSQFVYFGTVPVEADSEEAQIIIPYVRGVLDAMGVKNGPSHGEVVMTADGPCLVEMNCRAHGGDGIWRPLVSGLNGGYTQIEASYWAFVEPERFFELPDQPPSPFKACGTCVDLVSFSSGTVKSTPGFDLIRRLPSFVTLEAGVKPGSKVVRTIDLVTTPASVILMHSDAEILNRDIAFIRTLEEINALFEYEPQVTFETKVLAEKRLPKVLDIDITKEEEKEHHPFFSLDGPNLLRRMSSDGPNLIRKMSNDRPELRGLKRLTNMPRVF